MRSLLFIALVAITGLAGCDAKATASDSSAGAPAAEQRSREYESCGASIHCQDELRCFDQTCVRTTRSAVGDYFAASGAAALARGDHEAAIAAYAAALGHYDSAKVALPPDIDCAYGGALAAAKSRKDHAELGARVLHRCVLASPVGSAHRRQAIAALATLGDVGLDPLLLGASKTADLYLTKAPRGPATDKLTVVVTANPTPKNLSMIADKIGEQDLKRALIACWEQYNAASKKLAMAVTIGVKSGYVAPEYEDERGHYVWRIEDAVAMPDGALATADACVRQIVEPAVKGLKINEGFTTKLTVTVK